MPVVSVELRHHWTHKRQIQDRVYSAQGMVSPHALFQVHLIIEQLILWLVGSHHIPFSDASFIKKFRRRDLGNTPVTSL